MKNLADLNSQYETILHLNISDNEKDKKLAFLMDYMEKHFNIPTLRNVEWEKENKAVIALYRKYQ
ncbi:hypothetical protein [Metabacillus sediminilitoris]|uniref:Uncharacterized protein n=1 Tax=Metabacillus sediminilitoris TaxID=2567941 RepID=A0A4V3WEQ1_9BACI|nr:hypothetical protein [Metabacillus sediminilitoris]QGQ45694.1 hypothetical protein GMB29_10890 [Metabacillus sediminilitoris]THF77187.1 hypothetical protein E6W99_19565 [Metabacillus sediminilitoris]